MTSGGIGELWGNFFVRHFLSGWQQNLDTVGVTQYIWMANLFNSLHWWKLVPDQSHSIVTAGFGAPSSTNFPINDNYVTTAYAPDKSAAISYIPAGQTITVNLSAFSGPVTLRWFDPTSNAFNTVVGSPFVATGSVNLTPSGNNSEGTLDRVLIMTSSNFSSLTAN
jgi:hypothetical protein